MPSLEISRPKDASSPLETISDEEALAAFENGIARGLQQLRAGQVQYFDDEEDFFNSLRA